MVIASGMVTSRTSFSFGSFEAWPLSRWVRRRNEATERSRTSSARSAVTSVRRPRCFSAPARGAGRGAAAGRAPPPGRRDARGASSSSASSVSCARPGLRVFVFAEALLGDFAGLALGFLVVLAAVFFLALARLGGFALGAVAGFAEALRRRLLPRRSCVLPPRAGASRQAHGRARGAPLRSACAAPRRTAWAPRRRGAGAAALATVFAAAFAAPRQAPARRGLRPLRRWRGV